MKHNSIYQNEDGKINDKEKFSEDFPFLTSLLHNDKEYICIVQNSDDKIITFYDYERLRGEIEKKAFLELGDTWWWESNRLLPINLFFNGEMKRFRHALITLNLKDIEVVFGPMVSLNNFMKKRVKRRQIQLVKKTT